MKKRLLSFLLVLALLLGLVSMTALASNDEGQLLFRYTHWSETEPLRVFQNIELTMGKTARFYLYYGTPDNATPLTGGTLTSDNEAILSAGAATDGDTYYTVAPNGFGTATLTYTCADGTTYTETLTVSLPYRGFYSEQNRSEATYLSEAEYDPKNGTTLWLLAENGLEEPDISNLSATIDNQTYPGVTATAIPWASDSSRYDVKIELPAGLTMNSRGSRLQVTNNRQRFSLTLYEKEYPQLMYRYTFRPESEPVRSLRDWYLIPGNGTGNIYLYYGTAENYTPLSGGTFTSSNPEVIAVGASDDGTYYTVTPVGFGTATLTYSDGTNTYTVELTISLPNGDAFYSEQNRSEATYLSKAEYDSKNGTTLWVMNQGGYEESETTGWTVELNGNAVAEATAEGILRPGTENRYDMKITLPAGLVLGNRQRLQVTNGWQGASVQLTEKEYPRLLYRWMSWDNDFAYEDPAQPLMPFNTLSLSPGSGTLAYFYYGTTENCALIEEMTVVSGDSVSVHKFIDRDGKAYWRLQGEKSGDTVINIGGNNSITLSVKLPKNGFYTARNQSEANFVNSSNGVSYYQLAEKALWLMCAEGYTAEELDVFTVTVDNQAAVTERVLRDGSSDRYDLKIQLVEPARSEYYSNYQVNVRHPQQGNIASCSVNNQLGGNYATIGDYVVGFAWNSGDSEIIEMIRPDQMGYVASTSYLPSEGNPYVASADYSFTIMAGEAKTDAQGAVYYEPVPENKLSFQVKRTWFQVINGEGTALSWTKGAPDSVEKNDYPAGTTKLTIYNKEGYLLKALVFAELEITVGKQVHTATISVPYEVRQEYVDPSVTRPANDTVEALNAYLEELANGDMTGPNGIDIYLADTTYEGIIEFPSRWLGIRFHGGRCTTIKGGISLNGAYLPTCEGIHFIAPESDELTRAIWGGPAGPRNCTFYGYDVALDSTSQGLVSPHRGNIFVNNDIAIRVDVDGGLFSKWNNFWPYNTFLCNGTAIQILSLNTAVSSYYLRITNSNFVGNETDFDIQAPGTFYWQKNYFAKIHPQAKKMTTTELLTALLELTSEQDLHKVVTSNSPNLEKAKGMKIKVVTNPRWKYFITEAFPLICGNVGHITGEATENTKLDFRYPSGNILTSDWGDTVTQIVNDEAGDLVMDPSAFETEGDKSVTVVDGEAENVLGTWNFD